MVDCVASVRRRETELLTQLRAAFAGDPAVQAFIADGPSIEATLRGLENTCQLTDIIVRERSVELLLLKDDIAHRMTSLLQASLAQPPPHMRSSYVRFIPAAHDQSFPVGRLDFVDEKVTSYDAKASSSSEDMDTNVRPRGDGHDSVSDSDIIHNGGIGPVVEIKRRKMEVEVEEDEVLTDEMTTKRLMVMVDRETMTSASCVQSASTTMGRCVHVDDKLTATSSQLTADETTLTLRPAELCHRGTETDPAPESTKVKLTSQTSQTTASIFQLRSKYVETEPLPVVNKWTLTERPFQMDKVGHL